jgi:hypothetical protein
LIYLLALGVWLLGTGAGALIFRRSSGHSHFSVALLLTLFALLLPADIVFVRGLRLLFGGVPGAYLPFFRQIIGLLAAILPLGIPLGLLFQWAARRCMTGGRSLAVAYSLESAGAVLGGLASTLFLRFGISNLAIGVSCALFAAIAAMFLFMARREFSLFARVLSGLLCLGLIAVLSHSSRLDLFLTRWNHPQAVSSWDTPYGRLTACSLED